MTAITSTAVIASALLSILSAASTDDNGSLTDGGVLQFLLSLGGASALLDLSPRRFIALCIGRATRDYNSSLAWLQALLNIFESSNASDAFTTLIEVLQ